MIVELGSLRLERPVVLAPMAGVTDLPFRRLVKGFGADLVVTEMIASQALLRARERTLRMSASTEDEHPASVQLAGNDPEAMAEAARQQRDLGARLIDINMGCPVKKIVKGEAGAALMRDEPLAGRIMAAVVAAVPDIPVTVKMRMGWDDSSRNAPRLAKIAEESGIRAVTVHGRTRAQFYGGRADWRFIGEVKDKVGLPVIGNGDVTTPEEAQEMLRQSEADGVMVGRAALGRPWLLNQVRHYLSTGERLPDPPLAEQLATILCHYEAILAHYGKDQGVRLARKHFGWYSKGLPGSAEFRAKVMTLSDPDAVRSLVCSFYEPLVERMAA